MDKFLNTHHSIPSIYRPGVPVINVERGNIVCGIDPERKIEIDQVANLSTSLQKLENKIDTSQTGHLDTEVKEHSSRLDRITTRIHKHYTQFKDKIAKLFELTTRHSREIKQLQRTCAKQCYWFDATKNYEPVYKDEYLTFYWDGINEQLCFQYNGDELNGKKKISFSSNVRAVLSGSSKQWNWTINNIPKEGHSFFYGRSVNKEFSMRGFGDTALIFLTAIDYREFPTYRLEVFSPDVNATGMLLLERFDVE